MLYLLQLVQALSFEPPPTKLSSRSRSAPAKIALFSSQGLEDFLIARSVKNKVLGNHFYCARARLSFHSSYKAGRTGYLMVEMDNPIVSKMFKRVAFQFMTKISEVRGSRTPR
jgi:phosphatidylinositol 3-kinase